MRLSIFSNSNIRFLHAASFTLISLTEYPCCLPSLANLQVKWQFQILFDAGNKSCKRKFRTLRQDSVQGLNLGCFLRSVSGNLAGICWTSTLGLTRASNLNVHDLVLPLGVLLRLSLLALGSLFYPLVEKQCTMS
ncbi:hypothetical protein R1flu_001371 [Riccia fluitans]|uniref:Uncharacterized protein n=1 Tax=Riccia fluitans TaxID=41844 RepID=A0ABD1Y3F9_9MARC